MACDRGDSDECASLANGIDKSFIWDGNKTMGLGGRQVDASDNAFIAKYLAKRDEHTSSGAGRWSAKLRDVHAKS
uniref:Lipoprotein n=1 Tax=Macrostomum lignano TaxID=282301 RepID=A0A1I8FPG4_9PLAT